MAVSANSTPIFKGVRRTLLNTAGTVTYTVRTESPNELIFSGRATNRPGETSVAVELFDILAPHLRQTIPNIWDVYYDDISNLEASNFARRFVLAYGNTTENIDVRADYDERGSLTAGYLDTNPIRLELPFGAPLVGSVHYCPAGSVQLRKGTTAIRTISNASASAVNVAFDTYEDVQEGDTLSILWPSGTNGTSGARSGSAYKIAPQCGDAWVLYYVNIYGGLDQVWMKGICRRTDSFEREQADVYRALSNTGIPDRRVTRIDTAATWELNTGILTDAQAAVFARNVPGTPAAFLLKLGTEPWGWPVTIEDTAVQYLSAASNGRRPVNYTLTVKLAQDRVRL